MDKTSFLTFYTMNEHNFPSSKIGNIHQIVNSSNSKPLYPVNKLPEKYRHIFSNFLYFNKIQTNAIDTILQTDESVVVSSPTGSGKTVLFELAIIRFLEMFKNCPNNLENSKIIYVAPIKALCSERYEDWKNKFSIHGLKCIELTGDTEFSDDIHFISNYQLIITTPEKWDSLSRRSKEFRNQMYMVKLFLVDEVHLINDGNRGATLETIISRMKIILKITKSNNFTLRFLAVSATISNIEDIAKWLSSDDHHTTHCLKHSEDERPVKLQKIVLGYNYEVGGYKFDLNLTFKLKPLIMRYSNGRPTLIFCSTRKSVEFTCSILVKGIIPQICDDKQRIINSFLMEINSIKIKELIKFGIGCHHAGMSFQERSVIENLFRMGCLSILVATSTLAMGVNLPAHLVIVKSTEYYNFSGYREYNECQILQMIGRAGRPQFDSTATAIIMTKTTMKKRYEEILVGNQIVESHLHKHLIEHLNAEIFLGTIQNITTAKTWIRSTYLYVRACKSPLIYGMSNTLSVNEVEVRLQNMCLTEIKALTFTGLINFVDGSDQITSKPEGEIMAKYSLSFLTMKSFMQLKGAESLNDIIIILTQAKEFEYIKLRRTEKAKLNSLNKNKLPEANVIRFPIEEGIKTRETKINCLLQATLGTLIITDSSLSQDANKIILIALRLTKALREFTFRGTKFEVARMACILAKCVSTRLWEQSEFVSKLIPKVGPVLSRDFVLNGKTTLKSIKETDPRDFERFLNRNPPFGNHILDFIRKIPCYKVQTSFDNYLQLVVLKITLMNLDNISKNEQYHTVSVLVGDSDNCLLKSKQIRNEEFLEQGGVININVSLKNKYNFDKPDYTITICLISDQWIGTDIEVKLKPDSCKEYIKESMCEENSVANLTMSSTCLVKEQNTRMAKPKQTKKKEKPQKNIKNYLHNVSLNDLSYKAINVVCAKENKDTIKCNSNESNDEILKITDEKAETKMNNQNSDQNNKNLNEKKIFKNNCETYYCYDELINDNVFSNLFIPDDHIYFCSKTFDSIPEKCLFRNNISQEIYSHNKTQPQDIKPIQSKYLSNSSSTEKLFEINETITNTGVSTRITVDQLDNKENAEPNKSERSIHRYSLDALQPQVTSNKQLQKSPSSPIKTFSIKKRLFTHNDPIKKVLTNRTMHPRTLTRNLFDNVANRKSNTAEQYLESNFLEKKTEFSKKTPTIGRLSQQIKTNLKATASFYIRLDTENISDVAESGCKENEAAPINSEKTTHNEMSMASTWTMFPHRNNKMTLDKYFNVTKSRWRQQAPYADKFVTTATKNHSMKSPVNRNGNGQLHPYRATNFILDQNLIFNHGYDKTHLNNLHAATSRP